MAKKKRSRVVRLLLIGMLFVSMAGIALYLLSGLQNGVSSIANIKDLLPQIAKIAEPGNSKSSDEDVKYKFAIISDSHEDLTVYPKIVDEIATRKDLAFVAHLGDQSNAGESTKLQESKNILDRIGAPVYVLPGDHDSNWLPRRDLTNFKQVFGLQQTSYAITHGNERFIFIDNSDGSEGVSPGAWGWLIRELNSNSELSKYVFMSTPLSNPYLSFKTMGSQSDKVKQQAEDLGILLKEHNIKAIFAGDTHTFSQYKDKSTNIPIITVGATGTNKNPLPLYVVVEILSDGSYNVSSIPLKK